MQTIVIHASKNNELIHAYSISISPTWAIMVKYYKSGGHLQIRHTNFLPVLTDDRIKELADLVVSEATYMGYQVVRKIG